MEKISSSIVVVNGAKSHLSELNLRPPNKLEIYTANDRFGWWSQWLGATPAASGIAGVRACQFSINRQDRSPMLILSRAFASSDCDRARPLESLKLQSLPVVSRGVASTG